MDYRTLPKVELHDHLDGGLRVETILELADEYGYTDLPADTVEGLTDWFDQGRSGSLERYLEAFTHTVAVMRDHDSIRRIAYEHGMDLAADGVVYGEVRFGPSLHMIHGMTREDAIEAVLDGLAAAERETGTVLYGIACALRHETDSLEVVRAAIPFLDRGLIAFDLAGPEAGFPADDHLPACRAAREAGLGLTIHAGEADDELGPQDREQAHVQRARQAENAAAEEADTARMKHNLKIKTWIFEANATASAEAEVLTKWKEYVEADVDRRWNFTFGSKMSAFFLDTQFAKYWSNILHLDFGVSHLYKEDVLSLVQKKLRYSICLSVATLLIIYLVSVPLGIWSAANANSPADRVVTVVLFMLYSLPSFWVATILLNFLTKGTPFEILPTGGFSSIDTGDLTTIDYIKDVIWHITLPVLCMTYGGLAALSRYARTGLLDVIRSDYVRTARAKGLSEGVVIVKHAARNGMIPIITLLATLLPALIGGSVVIEFIFQIPGIGSFMFESIQARDYNVVMCILLITSLLTLVGMLLADLLYALVDPRITFD